MSSNLSVGEMEADNVNRLTGIAISSNRNRRDEFQRRLSDTWGAGERKEWGAGVCKVCCRAIDAAPVKFDAGNLGVIEVSVTVCDDCNECVREHYSGSSVVNEVKMTPKWDEECPMRLKELLETSAYPPNFDQDAFKQVGTWNGGSAKGLALVGPSASGKTTSLWGLFRKLERTGDNPVFLTGVELFRTLAKAARDLEQIDWLCSARILMIDDLGKERCSPAAAALLWELLDRRYQNKLPFFCSTRFSGDELKQRFGEVQLGGDILRRLNELCRPVRFKLQEST